MRAILARNLAPTPPMSVLFGVAGRHWLARQDLPADERPAVDALLRLLDFHPGELAAISKELAAEALTAGVVARLATIPAGDAMTAISIMPAVGDLTRFDSPDKLVSYQSLNPEVRQSGTPRALPHQQGRPPTGLRCPGRSGLVSPPHARAAARLLPAHPRVARLPRGSSPPPGS